MIYQLSPNIQRKIWGGKKIAEIKKIAASEDVDPIGETWEISVHPDGPSLFDGKKFQLLKTDTHAEELPYLVKLIDTGEALSVQVHPDDLYARKHENSEGKTECWLILNAEIGSGIYLGLKSGVTKDMFLEALTNKADISALLNFIPVKNGDFFYVPAGSIHAIGAGITLVEVQQSSGITYRVWDWNRVDSSGKPRQLHIEKSLDVINFKPKANTLDYFQFSSDLFKLPGKTALVEHSSFKMTLINLSKNQSIVLPILKQKRLSSILNLQGEILLNDMEIQTYSSAIFRNEELVNIQAVKDTSIIFIE